MQTSIKSFLLFARVGVAAALLSSLTMTAAPVFAEDAGVQIDQSSDTASEGDSVFDRLLAAIGMGERAGETDDIAPLPKPDEESGSVIRAVELIQPGALKTVLARNFFGQVVARETADLAFPLNGKLEAFPVEEGSILPSGDLLARLDLDPFQRSLERAQIQLAQAERTYQRARDLADRGIGPTTVADDAQSARDLARVQLREARDALSDAQISAPYRALIAERLTANHVIVEPGMPIVRVHDISQMRVEIDIPERLVQRVPDLASVAFSARLPGDDEPSALTVIEFEAETADVGQSYTFTLALPDRPDPPLLPGSSLTVLATLPSPSPMLLLPVTALAADEQRQPYVMVFEPSQGDRGILSAVAVDVTSIDGNSFSVSGLPPEVQIVKTGTHLLRDGQEVRRFTSLRVEE